MGKIEKILKKGPVEGQTTEVYPVTSTKAVYDENNKRLDNIITGLQESVSGELNTISKKIVPAINEVNTLAKSKGNGTITEVRMNGASKGTSGVVDLGTVITAHQDISGKVDKTTLLNTLMVVDLSSTDIAVRKAALDDFKAKWLALGNTDLNGARFIGRFSDSHGNSSIHESGKSLIGEDTLLIYRQISPTFPTGFYGLSYIKDMANIVCGLYQIYVDWDTASNPGNVEITQIRDSETLDLLNRFVYAEVPTTYLKITDAESTYETKTHAAETLTETLRDYAKSEEIPIMGNMATANAITAIKQDLSPVLQEINLTGTDADRKAKLDQFEADWKAFTGASNLAGARFIGYTEEPDNFIGIFIYNSSIEGVYSAIATSDGLSTYQVFILPTGAMISNSLFYHLQPITIRTDNTDYDMAANVAAIKKYIDNLTFLGVRTYDGFTIPVSLTGNECCGYLICNKYHEGDRLVLSGTVFLEGIAKIIVIDETGRYTETVEIAGANPLNTTSDNMVDAINEVNTLAKGYSALLAPIELTTDPAQNKIAIDARVAAFTAQGISLTNGYYIPVTYKGVYAGTLYKINDDWYGLLVKNTNNPADNINIKLFADGTIIEGNSTQ